MPWWVLAVLVLGANFALWGSGGPGRTRRPGPPGLAGRCWPGGRPRASTRRRGGARRSRVPSGRRPRGPGGRPRAASEPSFTTADVAVLIPAHNEALVIEDSLRSIMALVPRENVHVVSDGSTDDTVEIARRAGAQVIATRENVGKAGRLEEAIARFGLIRRFPVVHAAGRGHPGAARLLHRGAAHVRPPGGGRGGRVRPDGPRPPADASAGTSWSATGPGSTPWASGR